MSKNHHRPAKSTTISPAVIDTRPQSGSRSRAYLVAYTRFCEAIWVTIPLLTTWLYDGSLRADTNLSVGRCTVLATKPTRQDKKLEEFN